MHLVDVRHALSCYRFRHNVRFRRVSPVAVRPGEGLFSEPTAVAQPWRRELVFMPHPGHRPELVGALRAEKDGHSL